MDLPTPACHGPRVKLRVIGAGFGRTGTLSLKHALERLLGGRCYHMTEVLDRRGHPEIWGRKARGEEADLDQALGDYVAAVDWPTTRYYAELARLNPEAKVVLTIRDPQRWYESARETIHHLSQVALAPPARWLLEAQPQMRPFAAMTHETIWGPRGHFGGRFEDRDHAIAVYEAHIEEVKRTITSERLLVYEVKQGWGPLCEFLECPVPEEPMPHLNDRAQLLRRVRVMRAVSWLAAPVTLPLSVLRG